MAQLGHLRKYIINQGGAAVSGATATIYREGATVNGAQSGTSPFTVTVYHRGKLKASDTIFVGTSTTTTATVSSTTSLTSVVLSGFTGTLNLADGDRLVPSNAKPTLYADDQGAVTKANPLTSSSTGLIDCCMEFGGYDALVVKSPSSSVLEYYTVVPSQAMAQMRIVDEFNSSLSSTNGIQEAIDDLGGLPGHVVCSPKTYSNTAKVWLHSGVTLMLNGATITRATGSITDASANLSGDVIGLGPYGSNGTEFSSGTNGSNISIIGPGVIDGNQSNFTTLTNTNLGLSALRAKWTDGFTLADVTASNTLMDGWNFSNMKNLSITNIRADTVGQWSVLSSRNAISFYNNDNSTTFTNQGSLTGFCFKTVGDEAITLGGCRNLSISNGSVDGCDFGIEFTSNTTVSCLDIAFSNINFRNHTDFCITLAPSAALINRVNFSNIVSIGHATNHDAGAIYMGTSAVAYNDIMFSNCNFKNINTKDTTARNWVDIQSTSAGRTNLFFSNCSFSGLSTSTRTTDVGMTIRGPASNIFVDDVLFQDVPGQGVSLDDAGADVQRDMFFTNVFVNGCNYHGFHLRNNTAAATITEIYFNNCVSKNVGKQAVGADSGFVVEGTFAGASIDHIYFRGCRSFKTSGTTHLYGLNLTQSAGTVGPIFVENCDFTGTQTAELFTSGTITNLRCQGHIVGTLQSITAVGNTITVPSLVKNCTVLLDANANYTLTSAPTIANGTFNGQRLTVMNQDTVDTITLQDIGTLPNSNLHLSAATVALGPRDSIELVWNDTLIDWIQVAQANVV